MNRASKIVTCPIALRKEKRCTMYFNTKRRKRRKIVFQILSWALLIMSAVGLSWAFVAYVGQTTYMTGDSMKPTLKNGEFLFVHKLLYHFKNPERFDVVVFENHKNNNSHFYIKRIIGLPGETVQIKDGEIYINNQKLQQTPFKEKIITAGLVSEPMVLEKNEYFVMGDNANNSEDSRSANIGNVVKENIIGKIRVK